MSRPQQRGYNTCILFVPFWAASERCEGNTSFAYVLTEHSGQQSSLRERTRISFLIGLNAPKCHDLVSLAPLPSRQHFHPLPCPRRTSRFLTHSPPKDELKPVWENGSNQDAEHSRQQERQ